MPPSPPRPITLPDLLPPSLPLLTRILRYPPPATVSEHFAINLLISTLPAHLKAPCPLQHRLVSYLAPRVPSLPPCGPPLCALHAPLSAQLIHSIFGFVRRETEEHLQIFEERFPALDPAQQVVVNQLRCVRGLWGNRQRGAGGWRRVRGGCEACVLGWVGGDEGVVAALRAGVIARTRTRGEARQPTVKAWVEAWVDALEGERAEKVRRVGEIVGTGLRRVRKGVRKEVRRGRRAAGGGVDSGEGDLEEGDCEDEVGFEEKIIDYYAALPTLTRDSFPAGFERGEEGVTADVAAGGDDGWRPARADWTCYDATLIPDESPLESERMTPFPGCSAARPASSVYSVDMSGSPLLVPEPLDCRPNYRVEDYAKLIRGDDWRMLGQTGRTRWEEFC